MPTPQTYATWRAHPNAMGPASILLGIHARFREASADLVEQRDPTVIARAFLPLARTLHHHHHAEEAMLFPLVEKRTRIAPEQLQADHDELTEAIDAVEAGLRAPLAIDALVPLVQRFHEVLVAHLDREEELVVPVLLELTPEQAWGMLHH